MWLTFSSSSLHPLLHYLALGFTGAEQAAGATLGEPLVEYYVRLDSPRVFTSATNPVSLLTGEPVVRSVG